MKTINEQAPEIRRGPGLRKGKGLGDVLETSVRESFGVGLIYGSARADDLRDEVGGIGDSAVSCNPDITRHIDNGGPATTSEACSLLESADNAGERSEVGW